MPKETESIKKKLNAPNLGLAAGLESGCLSVSMFGKKACGDLGGGGVCRDFKMAQLISCRVLWAKMATLLRSRKNHVLSTKEA